MRLFCISQHGRQSVFYRTGLLPVRLMTPVEGWMDARGLLAMMRALSQRVDGPALMRRQGSSGLRGIANH